MRYGVVFAETDFVRLRAHLLVDPHVEQAAYLLCGISETRDEVRWLVREIVLVPHEGFLRKEQYGLTIAAAFTDRVLQRARQERMALVLVHSHPFDHGYTRYSPTDDRGEAGLFEVYYKRVPARPHASLLFGADSVTGRHWTPEGKLVGIQFIRLVGRTIQTVKVESESVTGAVSAVHQRQVLAFGEEGQRRLAMATIAVVGVGGTGSITAEQLVRLGVGRVLIIDDDRIEASNVARVFGSVHADIASGTPKVAALARWYEQISPSSQVETIASSVLDKSAAGRLREADVIFGCTDNHTSRMLLNQLAYQYLIPYIDMGNRVAAAGGRVTGGSGRVVVMTPLAPCLWCYEDIRAKVVADEALSTNDRESLRREGYIEGADVENPAVVSLNATVSGLAVTEALNLFTGFMSEALPGYKLHYRLLEQEVEKIIVTKLDPCVCSRSGPYWGYGDCRELPTTP